MIRPLFYAHLVVGRCSLSLELGAPSISDMLEYAQGCGIGGGQRNPNMILSEVSSLKLVRTHALAGFKQHKNPAVVSCYLPLDLSPCLIFRRILSLTIVFPEAILIFKPQPAWKASLAKRGENTTAFVTNSGPQKDGWYDTHIEQILHTHDICMYMYVYIYTYIVCVRVFVYIYIRKKIYINTKVTG